MRTELATELARIDVDVSSREALGACTSALAAAGGSAATMAKVLAAAQTTENRLEVDLSAQQLVAYADDGVTVRRRWDLATEGGEPVATAAGAQMRRVPA